MSQKTAKVGITVLVLATAFGVLLYTSLGESMQFYKYTDEVMANAHVIVHGACTASWYAR